MKFTTGEIITAATGRLCCPMEGVYKIFNFLTRDSLFTHQLPRAFRACQEWVREECPWTAELEVEKINHQTWKEVTAVATKKYGKLHNLEPLPEGKWEVRDPIAEAKEMLKEGNL